MSRRVVIRPQADIDLDEIFLHIAQDNLKAAHRFFDAAAATFRDLAKTVLVLPEFSESLLPSQSPNSAVPPGIHLFLF